VTFYIETMAIKVVFSSLNNAPLTKSKSATTGS